MSTPADAPYKLATMRLEDRMKEGIMTQRARGWVVFFPLGVLLGAAVALAWASGDLPGMVGRAVTFGALAGGIWLAVAWVGRGKP